MYCFVKQEKKNILFHELEGVLQEVLTDVALRLVFDQICKITENFLHLISTVWLYKVFFEQHKSSISKTQA